MPTYSENEKKSLVGSGLGMVMRNKRYFLWFWFLDLTLAEFGTSAFRQNVHTIMDHSSYANGLLHGFDLSVMIELFARPEFGTMQAMQMPAVYFGFVFFLATALFLPGVFQGYASTYRLPRMDFFRACGRNLWRFIWLLLIAGIVMGIVTGILFGINGVISKKAADSTNELLPFTLQMVGLGVIFLVMSTLRIWFDLTEVNMVLDDRGVWRSLGPGFRHTFRSLGRLLGSYVLITIFAAAILVGRHLDVDEIHEAREHRGSISGEPTHPAVAADSAVLATRRGGFLLAAVHDAAGRCSGSHRACSGACRGGRPGACANYRAAALRTRN